MSMNRILPLACAIWLVAFFVAVPRAKSTLPSPGHPPTAAHPRTPESLFTPSENCVACHNNLVTHSGEDVSIGATWRSTMMANAGRDPYWQASIRRETIDHPMHSVDIQNECSACHMPMLQKVSKAAGKNSDV